MKALEARLIVGNGSKPLSYPSKMPGLAFGIPAKHCLRGSKLAQIPGTVCHECYAKHGRYAFDRTQFAQERRFMAWIERDHDKWIEAMAKLISGLRTPWFRWFDSGDLQGPEMLEAMLEVTRRVSKVHFWMPTREIKIVRGVVAPENLVIRASADKIDGRAPRGFGNVSTVSSETDMPKWRKLVESSNSTRSYCPAPLQNNACGECRKCWDRTVHNVTYKRH
jgi:hypothetical protein